MSTEYPLLRTHTRRRNGKVVTYYYFDRRAENKRDIPLGKDFSVAVKKWKELYDGVSETAGTLQEAFTKWRQEILPNYTNEETKRCYELHLRRIERAFGNATWDGVELAHLEQYLQQRSAKTQANREMAVLSIVWNWARKTGITSAVFPAAGMERSRWKNKESAREIVVTDEMFWAVYQEGSQLVRDYMDLSTPTGLRPKDCLLMSLPTSDELVVTASKTGKKAAFRLEDSDVLPGLIERRLAIEANHDYVLTTTRGQPVSQQMLRREWAQARWQAVMKAKLANRDDLARELLRMITPDMRKLAAILAGSLGAATELLQHPSKEFTRKYYYQIPESLQPVR
jgi:hypothetical protein